MPSFHKFQVLYKISLPLFRRHVFTLSKSNNYKTLFNTSLAQLFNFFRSVNHNTNKRLLLNRTRLTATSLAACGLFNWDEHRITNEEIKNEVKEMMNVFEPVPGENPVSETDGKLKIDFEATRNFQVKIVNLSE